MHAVALREQSAAKVSFQWHQRSFPPDKIVNFAALAEPAARQFSGIITKYAAFAVTTATSTIF